MSETLKVATTPDELRDLAARVRRCESYLYGGAAFHEASLVIERYAALTEAAITQPVGTWQPDWMPIESAPKDGTDGFAPQILAWHPAWKGASYVVHWLKGPGRWSTTMQPTHWTHMPLPPLPPAAPGGEG